MIVLVAERLEIAVRNPARFAISHNTRRPAVQPRALARGEATLADEHGKPKMEGYALAKARVITQRMKSCSTLSVREELAQESSEVEARVVVHNGLRYPSKSKPH